MEKSPSYAAIQLSMRVTASNKKDGETVKKFFDKTMWLKISTLVLACLLITCIVLGTAAQQEHRSPGSIEFNVQALEF